MGLNPHNNWTYTQTSLLWQLSAEKKAIHEVVAFIGKPEEEIQKKASELGIVFKLDDNLQTLLKELEEDFLKELEEEILLLKLKEEGA